MHIQWHRWCYTEWHLSNSFSVCSAPVCNDILARANGLTSAVFWLTDKPRKSADSCSISVSGGIYKTVQILNCTWFCHPNFEKGQLTLSDVRGGNGLPQRQQSAVTVAPAAQWCRGVLEWSPLTASAQLQSPVLVCTRPHASPWWQTGSPAASQGFPVVRHESVIDLTDCWVNRQMETSVWHLTSSKMYKMALPSVDRVERCWVTGLRTCFVTKYCGIHVCIHLCCTVLWSTCQEFQPQPFLHVLHVSLCLLELKGQLV